MSGIKVDMSSFKKSYQWFPLLFGFDEKPETVFSQFSISTDENGDSYITSKMNNQKYCVGNFKVRDLASYSDIKENCDADIITCETNPANDGATFQMASNFNCLDHLPDKKPPHGLVSKYVTHFEQGGPGAVACGPALVYRQYLIPLPSGENGQMKEDIQLLSRTPAVVDDGYISSIPENFDWSDLNLYQVGVHQNIDVTLGRSGPNSFRIVKDQRIHQVFCSTVPFGFSVRKNQFTLDVASYILTAEYHLTILAAIENSIKYPERKGSKKLFLCLLGTGAFGNPIPLVAEDISKCTDLIKKSGLEVNLVCFNQSIADEVYPFLKETIEKTGGSVINL